MLKIVSKKLNIISKNDGSILPIIKSSSEFFNGFGEVYISTIEPNVVRAWKKHQNICQYFVVPNGTVKFVFLVGKKNNKNIFEEIIIGEQNYSFIKVPKNVWYGFANFSDTNSMIVNVINLPHAEAISEFKDYLDNPMSDYNW